MADPRLVKMGDPTLSVFPQPYFPATAPAPAQALAQASSSGFAPAPAPAPSTAPPTPARIPEHLMHKNRLQEYTQKEAIPMPIYQTVNEGFQHAPMFRSSVMVDGVTYTSPNTYPHRKAAEQDVAKLALEYISKEIKDEGCSVELVAKTVDMVFCKSILNEYAVKVNLEKPTYNTTQPQGLLPVFVSSLAFNGVSYTGDVGRSKKEAEQLAARAVILSLMGNSESGTLLSEIIRSKLRPYSALHKVKDTSSTQNSIVLMGVSTGQRSGVSLSKDNEVQVAVVANNASTVATPVASSGMLPPRHEFKIQKLEPSSQEINTVQPSQTINRPIAFVHPVSQQPPIAFVPPASQQPPIAAVAPVSQQPLDVGPSSAKKRRKNKKKANKRLRADTQSPLAVQ